MYSNIDSTEQNHALKQGKKFNDYQKDYLHIVGTKKLDLIEKTTSPNLGFLEPMSDKNNNPVEVENTKILDNLIKLENEFNTTLALYTSQYQQYMNKELESKNNMNAYTRKNVKINETCKSFRSYQELKTHGTKNTLVVLKICLQMIVFRHTIV